MVWVVPPEPWAGGGFDISARYGSQAQLQVWGTLRALTTGVQEGLVWALTVTAGSAHGLTLPWPVTPPPRGAGRAQQPPVGC